MRVPTTHDASVTGVRVRPEIEIVPEADGERMIAVDPTSGRQVRLSPIASQLLEMLDGSRSSDKLAAELGGLDPAMVDEAIARFRSLALVDDRTAESVAERPGPSRFGGDRLKSALTGLSGWLIRGKRRWRYRPPATVELTLVDPRRALRRLLPLADAVATTWGQALLWVITLAGLVGAVANSHELTTDITRPAQWWVALGGFGAVLLATGVHEFAHGLALVHAGGRVRRMGVMLLYGSPALFCDVSEAWRLPRRRRATVALAGARVHGVLGGLLMLVATATPSGDGHQLLVVASVGNAVMAIANLYPFVKFDGYVALVCWLDRPHLRARSIDAARDLLLTRIAFGAHPDRSRGTLPAENCGGGWILFGILSALSAPVLLAIAFRSYGPLLLMVPGPVGAAVVLALLVICLVNPTRAVVAASRQAALWGAPRWRRLAGGAVLSFAVGCLLAAPRVPLKAVTVYQQTGAGTLVVVPPEAVDLPPGAAVSLRRAGVVLQTEVGQGVLCGPQAKALVDRDAGSPIIGGSGTSHSAVLRSVVALCDVRGGPGRTGLASVDLGRVPLGLWIHRTFVEPALAKLT